MAIVLFAAVLAGIGILLEQIWPQSEAVSFALFLVAFGLYFQFIFKHAFKFARTVRRLAFKQQL